MSSPLQFYRTFRSLLRDHRIRHALTSGMACVEYGIQQNTKDSDWIIHPGDLEKLVAMLCDCERGLTDANWRISYRPLFGAPLLEAYHLGGWTTHIAVHDSADSPEHHLDFFGQPPRVRLEEVFETAVDGLASRSVIAGMKKTDRDKDWPFVEALCWQMEDDWIALLHLRTPERLWALWRSCPAEIRAGLSVRRPLLKTLATGEIPLAKALAVERLIWEQVNKQRYRRYQSEWKDFLRRWRAAPDQKWPVSLPFAEQHSLVQTAASRHQLPSNPLGGPEARQKLVELAWQSVLEVFDGQQTIIERLTPPIEELLP